MADERIFADFSRWVPGRNNLQASFEPLDNLLKQVTDSIAVFPSGVVGLEFAYVADPPDMIPAAIVIHVRCNGLFPRQLLRHANGFRHAAIAEPAAAHVVYFAGSRRPMKLREGVHQVVAVDIVADLLTLIPEDAILPAREYALY